MTGTHGIENDMLLVLVLGTEDIETLILLTGTCARCNINDSIDILWLCYGYYI